MGCGILELEQCTVHALLLFGLRLNAQTMKQEAEKRPILIFIPLPYPLPLIALSEWAAKNQELLEGWDESSPDSGGRRKQLAKITRGLETISDRMLTIELVAGRSAAIVKHLMIRVESLYRGSGEIIEPTRDAEGNILFVIQPNEEK